MDLSKAKCKPCEGGVKPMPRAIAKKQLKRVSGWKLSDKEIFRDFEFRDFREALKFANKVGSVAEKEDHHPNIYLHNYKKVRLTLSTHAIGGLSMNDFILAAKVNKLV